MRIHDRCLKRKSGNREPRAKRYIVPEGDKSEMQFFLGVRDNATALKIQKMIEIIPLENEDIEYGQSHPKRKIDNFQKSVAAGKILFDEEIDKVCFVFDRDPQSFKENQYDEIVEICEKCGYILCISNPCFEFFLCLHSDKVLKLDRDKMLLNEKQGNKRFLEIEVSKEFGCNKTNLNFAKFRDRIPQAIENEKKFCEDLVGLKTELGSNVGLFLESIMEK